MWTSADLDAWRRAGGVAATLRVRDAMSWPAIMVPRDATVAVACDLLGEHGIHELLVVDHGELVGALCACDLRRSRGRTGLKPLVRRAATIDPRAPLSRAGEVMDDHRVDSLASLWRGAWGIVTRGDLVRHGDRQPVACIACSATHHVLRHPRFLELCYCRDCIERLESRGPIAALYRDLGGG
jgi:CBS domain-containing protein